MLDAIIDEVLCDGDPETKELIVFSQTLPFVEVPEALSAAFNRIENAAMQGKLVEAMSEFMIEHQPSAENGRAMVRPTSLKRNFAKAVGVKRCAELLMRYLRHRNQIASFYAAKGLYESDRVSAIEQLRRLHSSDDPLIRTLVKDLTEEWGIE